MKQTKRNDLLDCLEKNSTKLRGFVIPDEDILSFITIHSNMATLLSDELIDSLQAVSEIANQPDALILLAPSSSSSKPRVNQLFDISSIPSEVLSLLADFHKGKLNEYLQELLNNAEIEVEMVKKTADDPNSTNELEIKIKLAATVIDKYSGLLKMVLGNKVNLSSKNKEIIEGACKVLDLSTSKLRRISLIHGINQLEKLVENYADEGALVSLMPCFFASKSKSCKALGDVLENLNTEALSEKELIGALFLIYSQTARLSNTKERLLVRNGIKELFRTNQLHLEEINFKDYIHIFTVRAETLELHWPKPFELEQTGKFILGTSK